MLRYLIRRLALGVLVLFGLSVLTFVITRVAPGDPAALWVGPRATLHQIEMARITLGLNRPLIAQYGIYMGELFRGNLGTSIDTHNPVTLDIANHLPASIELVVAGMFLGIVFGLPLAVWAAMRPGGLVDSAARVIAVVSVSIPTFWFALILQIVFFQHLGIFPLAGQLSNLTLAIDPVHRITGFTPIDALLEGNTTAFWDSLWHLVLPAVTLATYPFGLIVRMMRGSLLDVISLDHIRLLRALGQRRSVIAFKYAMKNAVPPSLTALALTFAYSLTGTFLIEAVFNWPGIGSYTANAVITNDYPAVMGVTLVIGTVYVLVNLIVDLVVAGIDPRVLYT